MKALFSSKYIDIHLIKGIVLGVAKADNEYALMLGCIVIEFKPQRNVKLKRGTRVGKPSTFQWAHGRLGVWASGRLGTRANGHRARDRKRFRSRQRGDSDTIAECSHGNCGQSTGRGHCKKTMGIRNRNTTNNHRWVYTHIPFPNIPISPTFAQSQKQILNKTSFKWQSIYVIFMSNKKL